MKEFRLSTAAERAAGVCFTAVALFGFGALLYALRNEMFMLIFVGMGAVLVSALLVMYVLSVLKAAVQVDGKKLHVKGVKNYTLDLSEAVLLQTIGRKNGQSTMRILVFSNKDEEIIATVPTMFTFRQGIWADPVAKEIAGEMGIEFQQNVPDWQLDKEKYKEHVQEEAEREKKEARERRQKKMALRIQKYKNQK